MRDPSVPIASPARESEHSVATMRRRLEELEWLQAMSRAVNAARTLDEVLDVVYDGVRTGRGYDRVGITLIDYQAGTYEDLRGTDDQGRPIRTPERLLHLTPDSPIWDMPSTAALLRGAEYYFTDDLNADTPLELRYLLDGAPAQNLTVGLRADGQLVGLIAVDNLISRRPISPDHVGSLLALANQLGTVIERERARTRAEHLVREALARAEELAASEERLRQVYDAMACGVTVQGPDGSIFYANAAAERMLGVTFDQMRGRTSSGAPWRAQRDDGTELPSAEHPALVALHTARPQRNVTLSIALPNGEQRWLQVDAVPMLDKTGRAVQVVVSFTDVTARKQMEEESERARKAAEQLARLRSDFVASVSHELRTPLTTIIGYGELLQAYWNCMLETQRLDRIGRIVISAQRQQRLVDDLLMLSHLESEVPALRPEELSVADLAQRVAKETRSRYRNQRIDLEGQETLRVLADRVRTLQVLTNLVDNAAKHTPHGSTITVSWRLEDGLAVVRVQDCGPGITAQGREHLFTRFGRAPGSRSRAGYVGTGLGLYLGRQLAWAMGGDLDLETTSEAGSIFRLRLPVFPSAIAAPAR